MLFDSILQLGPGTLILGSVLAALAYVLVLAVYRLFFSPIAKFPGPWFAAATGWYEFYYDIIAGGRYPWKIVELHEQYGPIIRINPWELHVSDAEFYSKLYVTGAVRRSGMFPRQRSGLGVDGSHNATVSHDLHRKRRKPMELFFTRQSVENVEPMVIDEVKRLDEYFLSLKGTGNVASLEHVFAALTGNIIGQIVSEQPVRMVTETDFAPFWYDLIYRSMKQAPIWQHFPFLVPLLERLPLESLLLRFYEGGYSYMKYIRMARAHIEQAKKNQKDPSTAHKNNKSSMVHYFLTSDLPESERDTNRLGREIMLVLGAGTATTTRALNIATYYIVTNPAIEGRLRREVAEAMSGYPERVPKWSELERVPFLTACIKEALRMSYGIVRRLPRTSPDVELQYKQWTIPKNTPVGMSALMMHTDPEVFPEPYKFVPERWLGDYSPLMDRNFVPFSKGSRNCVGFTLVYAEMNLVLATLFRPGGPKFRMYDTDESDVVLAIDCVIPAPKWDSKGTRVTVE